MAGKECPCGVDSGSGPSQSWAPQSCSSFASPRLRRHSSPGPAASIVTSWLANIIFSQKPISILKLALLLQLGLRVLMIYLELWDKGWLPSKRILGFMKPAGNLGGFFWQGGATLSFYFTGPWKWLREVKILSGSVSSLTPWGESWVPSLEPASRHHLNFFLPLSPTSRMKRWKESVIN